ncbi:hypothetical protein EYZ11_001293 [Aspergillus tanneri]|uniref:peptidylprolyl isomerase n=1 Tax=Aspergillus tanneri TaxID=1220188 RepID=A0A4S3JUX5_9EURO|nr:hypothetical protein EYZ11_001293 [Aspergillus tanneri]
MGVTKTTLKEGNKTDYPKKEDEVEIMYRGCLYDESKSAEHYMGKHSADRGPLKVAIGTGRVIQGWDEGVPQMSLGEKAVLTISGGFPGLIPPNAALVFEVELISINGRKA